jgi:spore maturation protein CgeB
MKLLIVGNIVHASIEHHYIKYLNQLELPTTAFNLGNYFDVKNIAFRIRNKLGDISIYKQANAALIKHCEQEKPTIVWVFKGIEIFPETLQYLKNIGIYLVNYNPDHPFLRTSTSHGGKQIEAAVPLYDFHFTYIKTLCQKFEKEYHLKSEWLPFGFELSDTLYNQINESNDVINKIAFVGNPDSIRANTVKLILSKGYQVDVYGHGWEKWVKKNEQINVYDAVYGNGFWEKIKNYKVQLNIFRPHNIGSHNMRTFEIPAIGGIQLAPYSAEHEELFKPEKEIFLYENDEQMFNQIDKLLNYSSEQILDFGKLARAKSVDQNYSYQNRANQVLQSLKLQLA